MGGRRLAALWAATAVATGVLAAAPPARATDVCTGQGTAQTGTPLTYPVTASSGPARITVRQGRTTSWGFASTPGLALCAPNLAKSLSAGGVMYGWCGLSFGSGATSNGSRFAWVGVGGTMVFTGGLVGTASVQPDVLANESCMTGADRFLVHYAVAKAGCSLTKSKGLVDSPVPVPPSLGPLPGDVVWVHSDGSAHLWYKLCIGTK
jgi:hypothetical protein